ncbi:MAG: fused MFS/spermidine synthase [Planctomycetes bacterium]|nr:fused MFS/spermidine synthase [Planctomycetota bacterium]
MRVIPFALTIFFSAFLLFQVQPLIARYILPWFGGGASVWSVTMLFFQTALLAGYGYSHLMSSRVKRVPQAVIHLVLLGLCALLLPIIPSESFKPSPGDEPVTGILVLLAVTVGLPYFALSTTGPLLQAWFSRAVPGKSPYPLYALSNVGSLLALLSFPFVFEPAFSRKDMAWIWSIGYLVFVALCVIAALVPQRPQAEAAKSEPEPEQSPPTGRQKGTWVLLAGAGSALLLSFTNELCIDVASVPFLWVLPLSIYLVSFIVTFTSGRAVSRGIYRPLVPVAAIGVMLLVQFGVKLPLIVVVCGYSLTLLILTVACHGEAYRMRPTARHLTSFYLMVSVGGALGGLFVAVLAPLLFPVRQELAITVLATFVLLVILMSRDETSRMFGGRPRAAWAGLFVLAAAAVGVFGFHLYEQLNSLIRVQRDFYGVFRVSETPEESESPWVRILSSGTTIHGLQYMEPQLQHLPTSYFGRQSGAGLTIEGLYDKGPMRVGVLGLGVGTLAAYGRPGDYYRFYEIVPGVVDIAHEEFRFLKNCQAKYDILVGDGRLVMEAEPDQNFDVLVLDAFSSDAIPVHIITAEAFGIYLRHLKPGGVLCINISNRHLDLRPVCMANAERFNMAYLGWQSAANANTGSVLAWWFVATRDRTFQRVFEQSALRLQREYREQGILDDMAGGLGLSLPMPSSDTQFRPWTDDYSNMFKVLR